jgi:hypothetical protein
MNEYNVKRSKTNTKILVMEGWHAREVWENFGYDDEHDEIMEIWNDSPFHPPTLFVS